MNTGIPDLSHHPTISPIHSLLGMIRPFLRPVSAPMMIQSGEDASLSQIRIGAWIGSMLQNV